MAWQVRRASTAIGASLLHDPSAQLIEMPMSRLCLGLTQGAQLCVESSWHLSADDSLSRVWGADVGVLLAQVWAGHDAINAHLRSIGYDCMGP